MEDKILKQIDSEVGRIINEAPYRRDGFSRFYGHQTFTNKLIEAAKFGYNIKESVNDKKYSVEEAKKLMFETYLNTPKYINPHAIGEWIDKRLSASSQENNEGWL